MDLLKTEKKCRLCVKCNIEFFTCFKGTKPICVKCYQLSINQKINSDENLLQSFQKFSISSPLKKNKLIIFDLNGLLVYRIRGNDKTKKIPKSKYDYKINKFKIWIRPNAKDFLKYCLLHFNVAIWSTAQIHNILPLIDLLFNEEDKKKIVFIWGQSECTPSGKFSSINKHKELVFKETSKIWDQFQEYNETNTLLIDDDEYKAERNVPFTAIHPNSWVGDKDDNFLSNTKIISWLEDLKKSDTVAEFVKENLFY